MFDLLKDLYARYKQQRARKRALKNLNLIELEPLWSSHHLISRSRDLHPVPLHRILLADLLTTPPQVRRWLLHHHRDVAIWGSQNTHQQVAAVWSTSGQQLPVADAETLVASMSATDALQLLETTDEWRHRVFTAVAGSLQPDSRNMQRLRKIAQTRTSNRSGSVQPDQLLPPAGSADQRRLRDSRRTAAARLTRLIWLTANNIDSGNTQTPGSQPHHPMPGRPRRSTHGDYIRPADIHKLHTFQHAAATITTGNRTYRPAYATLAGTHRARTAIRHNTRQALTEAGINLTQVEQLLGGDLGRWQALLSVLGTNPIDVRDIVRTAQAVTTATT